MIYERILKEKEILQEEIMQIAQEIQLLPAGHIACCRNGDYYKWYYINQKIRKYLPKSKRKFAEKLAYKKYKELQLHEYTQELKAIDQYLKYHKPINNLSESFLTSNPEYNSLITPILAQKNQEIINWINTPYKKNTSYPENLIHETITGEKVRSKSEAAIYAALYNHNIPFRYDAELILEDTFLYPDFTILHPRKFEVIYWEHFGQMDKYGYRNNSIAKLQTYMHNGIFPTIQLITTFETKDKPLTAVQIENTIQNYFF